MKKYIIIIVMLLVCLSVNVKAEEIDSDFEYYNITYEFLNSNEYYVTYRFKLRESSFYDKYYFMDKNVYLDTIENNLEKYQLAYSAVSNLADIRFELNGNKEYYLKYKGFLQSKENKIYGICIKTISNIHKKDSCDNSYAVSVYSFELNISNPEKINLTKDKIVGKDNLICMEEGESFQFVGGEKYEKDRYYNVTLYKELIFKSELDKQKELRDFIIFITPGIIVAIAAICYYFFPNTNKKQEQL